MDDNEATIKKFIVNNGTSFKDVLESEESLKDTSVQQFVFAVDDKCDLQVCRLDQFRLCYGHYRESQESRGDSSRVVS